MAAETNLITSADLVKAREIEFTYIFGNSIKKLMEALGVTRKIAKQHLHGFYSFESKNYLLCSGLWIIIRKAGIPHGGIRLNATEKRTVAGSAVCAGLYSRCDFCGGKF